MMWIRAAVGVALCALGGVWIAQGSGAMHGSMMTGHGQFTAVGGLAVLMGLALIGWSLLVLRRTGRDKR
jgi:ABC-type transporter Mla subunit MlaD